MKTNNKTRIRVIQWLMAMLALSVTGNAAMATEATADSPDYADKKLWPDDVQKTAYFIETLPKAPLYIWAATEKKGKETDPEDPANWKVGGKPATAAPGEGDDVYFPEGSAIRLKESAKLAVRHITVGEGVTVVKPIRLRPQGNVWIKEGGSVEELSTFTGAKNVFLRNDNRDWRKGKSGIANKIVFNKPVGSSVEILGAILAFDEMGFFCGTVVVGPDAILLPGNRSSQPVHKDATLQLMSGATFQKRGNQPNETDLIVSGTLLAGSPERPLTRDCTLGLSFKTKGTIAMSEHYGAGNPSDYGLVLNPSATLAVHTVDPKKARMVITWNGLGSFLYKGAGDPDPVDRLVDLVLQGNVKLSGVSFDRMKKGGISIGDKSMAQQPGISFGEHNEGKPEELFKVLDEPLNAKLVYSAASMPVPASQGGGKQEIPGENK